MCVRKIEEKILQLTDKKIYIKQETKFLILKKKKTKRYYLVDTSYIYTKKVIAIDCKKLFTINRFHMSMSEFAKGLNCVKGLNYRIFYISFFKFIILIFSFIIFFKAS